MGVVIRNFGIVESVQEIWWKLLNISNELKQLLPLKASRKLLIFGSGQESSTVTLFRS